MTAWWIDEPRLLGSANPGPADLARLRAEGFDTLICLLDTAQQPTGYEVAHAAALGFRSHHIPVRDYAAPTPEQLGEFVAFLDGLPAEARAVVHCQGGVGRTGTFAAAYLVSRGMTAEAAIREVRARRPGAIETPAQSAAVAAFATRREQGPA